MQDQSGDVYVHMQGFPRTAENRENPWKTKYPLMSVRSNPEYEFAGVFADQGISGYCGNRPEFQKMIQNAKAEEIDLNITKSISRFARNTTVLLEVTRELRQLGVAIYFEEQNIDTLSGDG